MAGKIQICQKKNLWVQEGLTQRNIYIRAN